MSDRSLKIGMAGGKVVAGSTATRAELAGGRRQGFGLVFQQAMRRAMAVSCMAVCRRKNKGNEGAIERKVGLLNAIDKAKMVF